MPHRLDGDVLVAPRYLAGTTGTDPALAMLEAAPGWTQPRSGADPRFVSPCQRLHAEHRQHAWTFTYSPRPLGPPAWSAHFEHTVPDELLAAFTVRLVDGVDTSFVAYLSGGRHHTAQTPAGVFAARGWEAVHGSRPWHMLAPDEHAAFHMQLGLIDEQLELRDRSAATWRLTAGPEPVSHPTWTASFTGHTPQPLLTAVATAVSDPSPVTRPEHRVPQQHRALIELPPSGQATRAAAAQIRRPSTTAGPPPQDAPAAPALARRRASRGR